MSEQGEGHQNEQEEANQPTEDGRSAAEEVTEELKDKENQIEEGEQ